jgi:hypothetical protein
VFNALPIQDDLRRIPARIIVPQDFQKAAIAPFFAVNDYNAVPGLFFGSRPE